MSPYGEGLRTTRPFLHFEEGGYTIAFASMNRLTMAQAHYHEMVAHVRSCFPEEGCGFVGGVDGRAIRIVPVENHLHSPVAYEMEPVAQIRAMLALESAGMELLAIFHSHPDGPAFPSPSDVAQAYYPDTMHVIISFSSRRDEAPHVSAYMISDGRIERAELIVDEDG